MTQHKLFVCTLCRFSKTEKEYEGLRGGQHLFNTLSEKLEEFGDRLQVEPVKCMAACDRACAVAFTGANKHTFIFSDLHPLEAATDVSQFCQQYLEHPTGAVPYQKRPEAIKRKLFVVLPPS
ncbi:MAG: DUF1636 domain-containing protein [Pseudanabaena sp.]